MARRASVIAVVLAASVAGATPAAAFELRVEPPVRSGPVLAGESVLWSSRRGRDAVLLSAQLDGRRPPGELVRRAPVGANDRTRIDAVASAVGFAYSFVSESPFEPGTGGASGAFGRFDAPMREFAGCGLGGFDLDGPLLVAANCGVWLYDLTDDAPPRELSGGLGYLPRIAGRHVAWIEPGAGGPTIVVTHLDSGAVVYRVAVPAGVASYDLGEDGTLAVVRERRIAAGARRFRLGVATVARPAVRRARFPDAAAPFSVRIAGDVIAYLRRRPGTASARLGRVDLAGRRRGIERTVLGGAGFDFDGRRLAWAERSDGAVRIRVARVR